MPKITPFLWFNDNLEEAMDLYTSIFKNSKVGNVSRYGAAGPGEKGKVMTATFELEGQQLMGLNGGPHYKFNEAVSLFVSVETQEEVDELWTKLTADGGQEGQCGWLKDRFGLSWQIAPKALHQMLGDPDPVRSQRAMKAMLGMKKIEVEGLRRAVEQAD
jgi:predicted 3-demethylubiquinone-9 3-methyltransferase (glyoxalase superfamily)